MPNNTCTLCTWYMQDIKLPFVQPHAYTPCLVDDIYSLDRVNGLLEILSEECIFCLVKMYTYIDTCTYKSGTKVLTIGGVLPHTYTECKLMRTLLHKIKRAGTMYEKASSSVVQGLKS